MVDNFSDLLIFNHYQSEGSQLGYCLSGGNKYLYKV